MIKKLKSFGIFLAFQVLFSGLFLCFAAGAGEPPPDITGIVDVAGRVVNIAMMVAGIVLVTMVAYGVWKSSLATGDPRGLEGAKQTWTYALYGFFIVVGAFAAFVIIAGALGISINPGSLLNNVKSAITDLMNPVD